MAKAKEETVETTPVVDVDNVTVKAFACTTCGGLRLCPDGSVCKECNGTGTKQGTMSHKMMVIK